MSDKLSKKERQEKLIEAMHAWQKIENAAVAQTARVIEQTENPLIRLLMEGIQQDSNLHHRIQQLVIDSLTRGATAVSIHDIEKVWSSIEKHIEIEKRTVELAEESLALLDHDREGYQKYLLTWLLEDEKKHDKLLEDLSLIKRAMYP